MAVQLPNTLKDFNVFIDGEGYAGRGVSFSSLSCLVLRRRIHGQRISWPH